VLYLNKFFLALAFWGFSQKPNFFILLFPLFCMPCVICFVGYAGSGKDAACNYLRKKFGFRKINTGSYMSRKLEEKGISPTHENKCKYSKLLLKEFGDNYIINAVLKDMEGHEKIAVSGVRRPKEMRTIKKHHPEAIFVEVFAIPEKRAKRRKVSVEKLLARDEHDVKVLGLKKVLEKADYEISNNDTKKHLYARINALLKKNCS